MDRYRAWYDGTADQRQRECAAIVNTDYDLVTDFYEFGWGRSFHFAARGESFRESILRHEQWLALVLGLAPGGDVLQCCEALVWIFRTGLPRSARNDAFEPTRPMRMLFAR